MRVILGSASPRRKDIMNAAGIDFDIIVSDCEEVISKSIPSEVVIELSGQKAMDVCHKVVAKVHSGELEKQDYMIIGADTVVALNDKIFGKPTSRENAVEILKQLSGNTHQVYTGVTIVRINKNQMEDSTSLDVNELKVISFAAKTDVSMYEMSPSEIEAYVETGEPMDKAGAYAIQGGCAKYIKEIHGEYNNVVGLPIARIIHELKAGTFLL